MTVRVVVVEDSLLVLEGIAKLLDVHDDIDVVALCIDLPSLLDAVEATDPDAVLTDIRRPPAGTDEGVRAAARRLSVFESMTAAGSRGQFGGLTGAARTLGYFSEQRG